MRELPKHREALSEPQLLHLQRAGLLFSGSEGSSRCKGKTPSLQVSGAESSTAPGSRLPNAKGGCPQI